MLTRLLINQFRSCEHVEVTEIGAITAFVGRNGVGKTNVLSALRWLAILVTSSADLAAMTPITFESGRDVEAEFSFGGVKFLYRARASRKAGQPGVGSAIEHVFEEHLHSNSGGGFKPVITRNGEALLLHANDSPAPKALKIGVQISALGAVLSLLPVEDDLRRSVEPLVNFVRKIHYYPLDEAISGEGRDAVNDGFFVQSTAYETWKEQVVEKGGYSESAVLKLLHLHLNDPQRYAEITEIIGPNGLGLIYEVFIESVEIKPNDGQSFIHIVMFRMANSQQMFRFGDLSAGTRRAIRLVTALLFDDSTVMLVEHPEDGIHRGLLKKLMAVLKEYSGEKQVMLSTHSSAVVNALDTPDIRLVAAIDSQTIVRPLSESEKEQCSRYLEDEGSIFEFIESLQDNE